MKKYYALIASVLAMLAGATSCGASAPLYGILLTDYDNISVDEDPDQSEPDDDVQSDEDLN